MTMILEIGDQAPDFTLATDSGTDFTLSGKRGEAVVLFFYPKDDTEGCTIENLEFTALADEFKSAGATLVGISPDSVEDHCRFRDKFELGIPLAADPDHKAIGPYGVWGEKTNFGKKYMGLIRTTYLVDANGAVASIWKVSRVKEHAAKVLEATRYLST